MTLHNLMAMAVGLLVAQSIGCGRVFTQTPTPTAETLHQAVVFFPDQVSGLLANGAEVDELDAHGNSALWVAARLSRKESVGLLLAAGANANLRGKNGWTPLHCTAFCGSAVGDIGIAKLLINAGADVNAVEPEYGETPLHYAVRVAESPDLVRLLLVSGAKIDAQSYPGRDTALQFSVARRNHTITEILLDAGASPTIVNSVGFVPQQQAPEDESIARLFEKYATR
jgi:hypothetical protein